LKKNGETEKENGMEGRGERGEGGGREEERWKANQYLIVT